MRCVFTLFNNFSYKRCSLPCVLTHCIFQIRKEFDGTDNKRGERETHIFFEFYKIQSKEKAREAENFILSIAEPVNRPSFIHEYKLTVTSLYAAVTIGKTTEDIINELTRQSKNVLPSETVSFIEKHTRNIGKLELVDSDGSRRTNVLALKRMTNEDRQLGMDRAITRRESRSAIHRIGQLVLTTIRS
jgi:hypothetical protein